MRLPPSVTLAQTSELLPQLQQALADGSVPTSLRIDASALERFDTSALALLLHARRLARAAGRGFEIVGAPPRLGELARLYGVEHLLALPGGPSPQAPVPPAGASAPPASASAAAGR